MSAPSDRPNTSSNVDTEPPLTPLEAALYLGVTPELLFFYTSNSFQKGPGLDRRLRTLNTGGATRFSRTELDDFDHYLRQPWADIGEKRRDVPQKILAYLHAESGGCCVRCHSGIGIETAHIEAWATSRSNHHHNLLRICSSCHSEHDLHRSLSTEELKKLKAVGIEQLRTQLRLRISIGAGCPAPTPESLFVGHETELNALQEALCAERFVLVHGPGGAGKTQLMLQALAKAETGRAVLWIEVERYGSVDAICTALTVATRDRVGIPHHTDLIRHLDTMQACLVLDGVEQLQGPALDAIDDWIYHLQTRTVSTQVLVTSQVDLQRSRFDRQICLQGLDDESSHQVLNHFVRPGTPFDSHYRGMLLAFADGHPLTLRLLATLVNFFGSGRTAYEQIKQRGVELIEVQKRSSTDRRTSLRVCLSLAYDALGSEERRLLFLVANAPGGLFSKHIESGWSGILNGQMAIAGVRRWGLVRLESQGGLAERVYMLSPIANYVISRWQKDAPAEAKALTKQIVSEFAVMAAVIDSRSEGFSDIPYMLSRFEQELPNILRIFDFAESDSSDPEICLFARAVCAALMRYFFVLRLGDSGIRVMLRGVRIALRDKKQKTASDLLVQMIGLMPRSDNQAALDTALTILNEIEHEASDAETRGNLSLARAMHAHLANDIMSMAFHSKAAIAHFEEARADRVSRLAQCPEHSSDEDLECIENDLSSSFGLLGGALLAQGRHYESASAYRTALSWLRGASIPVNEGQLYHQIGNCESHLGNHETAAQCYITAAERFRAVGMREYLSNALSELGHTVLALDDGDSPLTLPSSVVINDGLADVIADLTRGYANYPFDIPTCMRAVRKLFGLIVLASLESNMTALENYSEELRSTLFEPALATLDSASEGQWDEWGEDAIRHLDSILALAEAIVVFERHSNRKVITATQISELAKICHRQGYWSNLQRLSFSWLSLYLHQKWALPIDTAEKHWPAN